jgi:tRNA A37 threonylcarbamoyladenosine modification protein TsaB
LTDQGIAAALIGLLGIALTALLSAYVTRRKDSEATLAGIAAGRDQNFWQLVENLQEENHRLETRLAHRDARVTELGAMVEQLQSEVRALTGENWQLKQRVAALEWKDGGA